MGAWTSPREYWDEANKHHVWDELTLNLCLTEASAAPSEELIRAWMDPNVTLEGMEAFIRAKGASGDK